jgi:hypothetical protein
MEAEESDLVLTVSPDQRPPLPARRAWTGDASPDSGTEVVEEIINVTRDQRESPVGAGRRSPQPLGPRSLVAPAALSTPAGAGRDGGVTWTRGEASIAASVRGDSLDGPRVDPAWQRTMLAQSSPDDASGDAKPSPSALRQLLSSHTGSVSDSEASSVLRAQQRQCVGGRRLSWSSVEAEIAVAARRAPGERLDQHVRACHSKTTLAAHAHAACRHTSDDIAASGKHWGSLRVSSTAGRCDAIMWRVGAAGCPAQRQRTAVCCAGSCQPI